MIIKILSYLVLNISKITIFCSKIPKIISPIFKMDSWKQFSLQINLDDRVFGTIYMFVFFFLIRPLEVSDNVYKGPTESFLE